MLNPHEKLVVTIDDPAQLFYTAQKLHNVVKQAKELGGVCGDPDVLREAMAELITSALEFQAVFLSACMDEAAKRLQAQAKAAPLN
jgi:hypothetical protein